MPRSAADDVVVVVEQGALRGARDPAGYYGFRGFRTPSRRWAPSGSGTRCVTRDVVDVQLPAESVDKPKAVMVWIHGGGFYMGSGNTRINGPEYLMTGDVVLVTFNYRLGALGFLSTEDGQTCSNCGLKDQAVALRWVQRNIAQFGGDPHNVTIFGVSAGGGSVHFHLLSPMSRGLFHRAIAMSGVALNPWALVEAPRDRAFRLGAVLGCHTTDSTELVRFLRSVPARELIENVEKAQTPERVNEMKVIMLAESGSSAESYPAFARNVLTEKPQPGNLSQPGFEPGPTHCTVRHANRYSTAVDFSGRLIQEKASNLMFFAPTLEKGAEQGAEVFVPGQPLDLMRAGLFHKVPFVSGITSHEGMLVMRALSRDPAFLSYLNNDYEYLVPYSLKLKKGSPKSQEVAQRIKKFYFGDKPISRETLQPLFDLSFDCISENNRYLRFHIAF
ncbi:hypothetical protein ANN_01994 [Periplaneta americana]|uniref:Carboxylic ester hydrolase n=1 Tax=Periplaneta americana TaxID=6978 RepID=A0ABQ8TV00_PERAM|nr:hypothetical protein ANN_01994 [Periplaneta americana]